MKKTLSLLLAVFMIFAMVACTPKPPTAPASETPTIETPKAEFDGKVYVGVVVARTGEARQWGDMTLHAIEVAQKEINEAGGIMGKEVILVVEDEIDSLQTSVNATAKLLENKELSVLMGSMYSPRLIAAIPAINDAQIPCFTFGSSAAIFKEGSDWVWMPRPADTYVGPGMVEYLYSKLNCKNPAIMYTTDAFGEGLMNSVVKAYEAKGVTVNEKLVFGIQTEEKNVTPQLTQIINSNADCFIAIGTNVVPYVVNQCADIGIDIPCMGSMAFANQVAFNQCGPNTNGWYASSEWSTEVRSKESQNYMDGLVKAYGNLDSSGQPSAYDAMYIFKAACEIAGTTSDPKAINDAIYKIDGLQGAMGIMSSKGDHCLGTELIITQNKDLKANIIDRVTVR